MAVLYAVVRPSDRLWRRIRCFRPPWLRFDTPAEIMRILIYSLNYAPESTGTGKYTGEMASWLASRGHTVEVICGLPHYPGWKLDPAYKGGRRRREAIGGVQVSRAPHFIPPAASLTAGARVRLETTFTLSAARYWISMLLRRRKPQAVIAVMPPLQIGVWPLLFHWTRHVPWVLHVQDLQVDAAFRLNILRAGKVAKILYSLERFVLRRATAVSTITSKMRSRIIEKGVPEPKTWLFPNWTDTSFVRPATKRNPFRSSLDVPDEDVVALYAGNMGDKQGLEVVLEAADLCRKNHQLHFVLVGDGASRSRLEMLAQDLGLPNLRFLPLQPLEVLPEMLAAGDIHLVVQKSDAADLVMPSKLTNIFAAGRPCVATASPNTTLYNVVRDHDVGEIAPPGDGRALAHVVTELASNPERRIACGERARAYAEKYLCKDRILSTFEEQLESICK